MPWEETSRWKKAHGFLVLVGMNEDLQAEAASIQHLVLQEPAAAGHFQPAAARSQQLSAVEPPFELLGVLGEVEKDEAGCALSGGWQCGVEAPALRQQFEQDPGQQWQGLLADELHHSAGAAAAAQGNGTLI